MQIDKVEKIAPAFVKILAALGEARLQFSLTISFIEGHADVVLVCDKQIPSEEAFDRFCAVLLIIQSLGADVFRADLYNDIQKVSACEPS